MARCLMTPSHYLNQWCLASKIISDVRPRLQWDPPFYEAINSIPRGGNKIQWNMFEIILQLFKAAIWNYDQQYLYLDFKVRILLSLGLAEKSVIRQAIGIWENKTCIHFQEVTVDARIGDQHIVFFKLSYYHSGWVIGPSYGDVTAWERFPH